MTYQPEESFVVLSQTIAAHAKHLADAEKQPIQETKVWIRH
jgi:hypothetical protein